MTRSLVVALCAAFSLTAPTVALAEDLDLTGTWNVTTKPGSLNTCSTKASVSAYQWILAVNGKDVKISVQGETGFPKLTGTLNGNKVSLDASRGDGWHDAASAVFVLSATSNAMTGTRYWIGRDGQKKRLCMMTWEVTAKKQ